MIAITTNSSIKVNPLYAATENLKKIDLYWLIEDRSYFEWFTKMLKEMEEGGTKGLFNYHIYFVERSPDEISRKMMYISTDIHKNKTSISLVDNLWSKSRVGIPDWNEELGIISSVKNLAYVSSMESYSKPRFIIPLVTNSPLFFLIAKRAPL